VFGIVSAEALPSGIRFVNPLARVVKLSIQTNQQKETMQVLSREGLTIGSGKDGLPIILDTK
jgi:hypothetical protein